MSEPVTPDSTPDPPGQPDSVDWSALERTSEFQELRRTQRHFLIPATIVYVLGYFGFLVLALHAPVLFGHTLHAGLNLGFLLMTLIFVAVWLAVLLHNSVARRRWDPLIARVRERAEHPDEPVTTSDGRVTQ